MLGLGSNIVSKPVIGKSIVRDGLVLKHDYSGGPVDLCSTGAASLVRSGIDHIDLGASNGFITGNNVTIAAWFKLTDSNQIYLIQNQKSTASTNLALLLNKDVNGLAAGKVSALAWDGSNHAYLSYDGNVDTDGKWHHLAVTLGGSGQKLYFDGVLVAENTVQFSNSASTDSMFIGALNGASSAMGGYVCNAGIWSATLSQPQVKSIMQKDYAGLSDSEKTDLVSWWNLDSVIPELTTAVYDNHGGKTFGSEILNQPILTGTGWSNVNGTVSDNGVGTITVPADGGYSYFRGNPRGSDYTAGAMYKIVVTVQGTAGKDIRVRSEIGSDNGGLTASTGRITLTGNLQTETFHFMSNSQDDDFRIERHDSDEAYSFDIHFVSLKKLNGKTGTLL